MTSESDTNTWHCNATWHWQCHVSLLRVTLTRGIFFSKNLKIRLKNHRLTCGTSLTALVNYVWKGPNWSTFSKGGMQLTLF